MVEKAGIRKALAAACLLLASVSFPGYAQPADRLVPRRMLLVVFPQPDSRFTASDALLLQRSLHQRIQEAEPDLVLVDSAPVDSQLSASDLAVRAGTSGTDAWMQLTLAGDWTSARISVKVFDLLSNVSVADFTAARTSWGSVGGLSLEAWPDIARAVAGKFPLVENTAAEQAGQDLVQVTVLALPGSLVSGLGKKPLEVGAEGRVSAALLPWHEYTVRANLAGYVPVTQKLFLVEDREIDIPQKPASRWALELSLTDSRAPGLDVTMAVPAQSLFFRLGFATYALGLALDGSHVFLNDPLTSVTLQAGLYASPEDAAFRWYAAIGAVGRVLNERGATPVLEPLAPLGLRAALGVELPASDRSRLFFEYTPTVFSTGLPDALRASLGKDAPGWIFFRENALDLLSFRVGWRKQL